MSSRDHHSSSSSSRKRDRSVDDHKAAVGSTSSRSRSDKDKDTGNDRDRDRDRSDRSSRDRHHSSSHSSRQLESSRPSSSKRDSSPKRHRSSHDHDDRSSSSRKSKTDDRDRDDDRERERERDRSSKKSSKRDSGKEKERRKDGRPRSSKRRDSEESEEGSGSGSGSDIGSETDSDSEEDELVKKAKSLIQTISEDDYFTKSSEFRLWLRKSKKKYFEELSAEEARKYFRKFVRAWNDFELDESYYKGIRSSQLSIKELTKYQWGFAKKIGKDDLNKVEAVRDSIDTMTNTRFAQEVSRLTGKSTASGAGSGPSSAPPRRTLGPSMPPPSSASVGASRRPMTADEVAEKEERDQYNRVQHRAEQKAYRKTKEVILEELVPKATGREAMLEKRRAQTAYHRRERSPDVELPEQDLMGTGDDFKSMLAAEKRRNEAKDSRRYGGGGGASDSPSVGPSRGPRVSDVVNAKQQAYNEKEQKQLEAFRQLWAQTQAAKGL